MQVNLLDSIPSLVYLYFLITYDTVNKVLTTGVCQSQGVYRYLARLGSKTISPSL